MDRLEAELVKDIIHDLLYCDSAKVGSGSGLPDHRVPADESDGCVPASNCYREVEGCDATYETQRIPNLHHKVTWSLTWQYFPLDGTREASGHITDIYVFLNLAEPLALDLAHLE
jgi:hypothetical protein